MKKIIAKALFHILGARVKKSVNDLTENPQFRAVVGELEDLQNSYELLLGEYDKHVARFVALKGIVEKKQQDVNELNSSYVEYMERQSKVLKTMADKHAEVVADYEQRLALKEKFHSEVVNDYSAQIKLRDETIQSLRDANRDLADAIINKDVPEINLPVI